MANPKGNPQNFKDKSPNEARKNGQKGGIKSGETRRAKRTHREILEEFGSMKLLPIGEFAEILSAKMPNITFKEAVDVAMLVQAANGNKAAADYCRDTEGEKPTDKVDVRATTTFEDFIDGIN